MDENEIIRQCRNGNSEAFAQLVHRFQYGIIALASNITGDPEEARDVAQDAFTQAYLNLDRFDSSRNFKNWLMGIAVKRSIDRLRKARSFNRFFSSYKIMNPLTRNPGPAPVENKLTVQSLLKRLNGRERSIMALQLKEGLSIREVAEIFNCSENTVRVHLFKARKKIREIIRTSPDYSGRSEVEK
jgi:RNA polymerase sigma-70 factor (ECF subfamily)